MPNEKMMDEYLASLLSRLTSRQPSGVRAGAASDIAIFLERVVMKVSVISQPDFVRLSNALLERACRESDREVRIEILSALVNASMVGPQVGHGLDVKSLCRFLETGSHEEIDYVLCIFGFSMDRQFLPLLRSFETHENSDLRKTAREAIDEMLGKPQADNEV